jgi:hypothetical protein
VQGKQEEPIKKRTQQIREKEPAGDIEKTTKLFRRDSIDFQEHLAVLQLVLSKHTKELEATSVTNHKKCVVKILKQVEKKKVKHTAVQRVLGVGECSRPADNISEPLVMS